MLPAAKVPPNKISIKYRLRLEPSSLPQSCFDALQDRKRSRLVAVDFEAAFGTVWRGGLLRDLARNGMPSRILHWLKAFLSDRREAVQWSNRRSRFKVFQAGVPQGSPLSPLLFNLFTASLLPYIRQIAPESTQTTFRFLVRFHSRRSSKSHATSTPSSWPVGRIPPPEGLCFEDRGVSDLLRSKGDSRKSEASPTSGRRHVSTAPTFNAKVRKFSASPSTRSSGSPNRPWPPAASWSQERRSSRP